jgi:formyl-CoA transferase
MFDVMADWMSVPLLNTEVGKPPPRMGLSHPSIAPYGAFRSKDGKDILISIQSEREWKVFCSGVLEQPKLPEDSRFATMVDRVDNRAATDEIVADLFGSLSREQLIARLDKADIAYGEVNSSADLSKHPHLRRIDVDTEGGRVSMPAPAAIVVGETRSYRAVPRRGADSSTILPATAAPHAKRQSS